MQKHLTGLIAATFTPMHEDGSININVIDKQAESLIANGVSGAFICGTNGESMSLTIEERMAIAERWVDVAGKNLSIIVHVGHNCLSDCKEMALHAQKIGAKAVAAVAPSFFKPASVNDLVDFCAEIAVSAPALPFYYYHIPSVSGVNLPMIEFLERAKERIPNLAGIKFSYENLMDFSQCLNLDNERFDMLFGKDEVLLSAMILGAKGAVGSTYNFSAPLYHLVMTAYQAGDIETAKAEQWNAVKMVAVLIKYGGISTGKAIMKMIGIDCGPVRLPLRNLSREQYDKAYAELSDIGFFSYCSVQAKGDLLL
ncbi:MAG: Dihydrodipicolinate synthetase [Candidatus Poribacteria bacterium]|nr:Dihydrodipicolinate synthetase [Candidatus Poribacteria bacterium]